jgi:hypothetical protein
MTAGGLLALIRPPNVFTAFADGLAGLLIVWGAGHAVPDRACAILLASACLYLAGIVLNDLFDRQVDAVERPGRPIPSGRVSVREAALLGAGLVAAGLAIAAWVGPAALSMAMALAACILLYDGGLKATPLGPLAMGACRGLDLAMGVAAALPAGAAWPPAAIGGAVVLGLYVASLTYIARDEVGGNSARRARTGLLALGALAAVVVIGLVASSRLPVSPWAWPWVGLALVLGWRNWGPVWRRHDGPSTGRAIGGGILLIPVIDAAVCAVGGTPFWAVSVALLALPALALRRLWSPT